MKKIYEVPVVDILMLSAENPMMAGSLTDSLDIKNPTEEVESPEEALTKSQTSFWDE